MAATAEARCVCSHPKDEHPDLGACSESSCGCSVYIELCPGCRHRAEKHDGTGGKCTVIKHIDRQPCGCLLYPQAPEPVVDGS